MKITNKHGKVITKLGIGCLVCLLCGFGILLYAQEKTKSEFLGKMPQMDFAEMKEMNPAKIQEMMKARGQGGSQRNWADGNRSWGRQNRGEVDFGENAAFYRTIIDHNLFRPLGWTPPKNEPQYSLVSTAVNQNGAISQATLLERRSNRHHFVTIGTKLGDVTVKDIQARKVTLDKAGEPITLKIGELQLLTVRRERGGNRGGERGGDDSEKASNNNASQNQSRAKQMDAERRRQMERQKQMAAEWKERMEKMRSASPEERREMIEEFRRRAGSRRGRGRDR